MITLEERDGGPAPELWEQQPGETPAQFHAFARYRDLHPRERSLAEVGRELGVSTTYVERLSAAFRWVQRVVAWDRAEDERNRERVLRERRHMDARHAAVAAELISKLAEATSHIDPAGLKPVEIARLLEVAVRAERLALGADDRDDDGPPTMLRAHEIRAALRAAGALRGGVDIPADALIPPAERK